MTPSAKKIIYILLSLALIFFTEQTTQTSRIWAQQELIVQPALRDITLTGYTRSQTTLTLSSEVAGKVLKINYDVGQLIDTSPFVKIDSTFIDLEINSTRQNLENLSITRKKRQSRAAYLDKEFQRIDRLFRRGSSPESKLDSSREDLDQARFDVQAVEGEIAILQTHLRKLRERKKRHTIIAPKGWIVVAKLVEENELVTVNTPVVRVADYENLVVPLSVSAEELAAIQKLPPEFEISLEGKPAKAAVNWINPEFDEKTRKLSIELILRSYPGTKRGGLTCRLALQTASEGLRVPKRAVISRYENPRVFLKASGADVKVLVLGQTENHFIIADNPRLPPGTLLQAPAALQRGSQQEPAR
jgi:RND family efflux transporter MFP subunit